MTMVFRLKDPMWTVQFKVGDPIRFRVIDLGNGRLQVIELEKRLTIHLPITTRVE